MISLLSNVFVFFRQYFIQIVVGGVLLTFLEYLLPQYKYSFMSRIRGAFFWVVYIFITAASLTFFRGIWVHTGINPIIHIDSRTLLHLTGSSYSFLSGTLLAWVGLQVGEFFYYWFHRFQHANSFLWRFHSVHHSLVEMSAFNSNHHFTEEIFRIPFVTIPVSLFFIDSSGSPLVVASLLGVLGIYVHSSTRLNFSSFRLLIADNKFHRIHHSVERIHWNRNFGSGSVLWDVVFGTAYFPIKNEWPKVGLDNSREPRSLQEFLFRPFHSNIS